MQKLVEVMNRTTAQEYQMECIPCVNQYNKLKKAWGLDPTLILQVMQ